VLLPALNPRLARKRAAVTTRILTPIDAAENHASIADIILLPPKYLMISSYYIISQFAIAMDKLA